MQRYIGIDLGGTNIKGALVSETGKILKQRSAPTHAEAGAEAVTKTIAAMICALAEGESVSGVGMGCPGTVDDQEGTVVYACNLGWVHYDVRTALRELTGYSVRLVNDANAAALAEAAVGAAKGAQSAVVVTLGTGVGGGVVLKFNANQKYTTDGVSEAVFHAICQHADVPVQHFANRSDMPGGSTLGNISGGHVSVNTLDIGLAQLAMHSSYETAGTKDVDYMIRAMRAFYETEIDCLRDGDYQLTFRA